MILDLTNSTPTCGETRPNAAEELIKKQLKQLQ